MQNLIFIVVVAAALGLVLVDVVVRRRRGAALLWSVTAGVVLLIGGVAHTTQESGLYAVLTLVLGALCLTLADRAASTTAD